MDHPGKVVSFSSSEEKGARMSSPPIKIATTDRILDASLKLFNEQGFHRVPAMRIAESLGISPGHLAYHFKNKSDILLALFPRLEKALQEPMQLDMPPTAPVSIDCALNVLKTLWSYRFFYIELPQLVQDDKRLRDSCLRLEERMLNTIESSVERRIKEGLMRSVTPPNSIFIMAKCVWRSWHDWVRAEQIQHPGQPMPSRESVYEAMLISYCLLQPYLKTGFLDEVVVALKKRLMDYDPNAAESGAALAFAAAQR